MHEASKKISFSSMMVGLYILIYTIGFCFVFDFEIWDSVFCVAHAILAVITMNCTLNTITRTQKYRNIPISLGGLCLYTINMYFVLSAVKYGTKMVYDEFSHDNWFRFIGTAICFVSIILTNYSLRRQQRKNSETNSQIQSELVIRSSMMLTMVLMIIVCVALVYESIQVGSYYSAGREWNTPLQATIVIFRDVITYLVLVMAVSKIKRNKIVTYTPVALFVICVLLCATISGSRTNFVRPLIVVIYLLIMFKKINAKRLRQITCLAPIGIILISVVVFTISNRLASGVRALEAISMNIGYRFDLSDFAMNCMERSMYLKIDFSNLIDGMIQAIPSALLPYDFKSGNVVAYTNMLSGLGLSSWKDYTDSYFSMGAEVLGVIGMIFIPMMFVILFEKLDCFATRKYAQGILIKAAIALWATTIERNWNEMIPLLRNVLIYIIVAMIFERLIIRYRMKAKQKAYEMCRQK